MTSPALVFKVLLITDRWEQASQMTPPEATIWHDVCAFLIRRLTELAPDLADPAKSPIKQFAHSADSSTQATMYVQAIGFLAKDIREPTLSARWRAAREEMVTFAAESVPEQSRARQMLWDLKQRFNGLDKLTAIASDIEPAMHERFEQIERRHLADISDRAQAGRQFAIPPSNK